MSVEKWYTFTDEDWKILEDQFKSSYLSVLRFITENKGSLSEARDVYIEAFFYYTRSVELKGKTYLEKSSGLIYSFSRIIWHKKLEKRNVDLNFVQHRREYYDLDHAFHEIDLMNERSEKAASKLALIGEPCRTMMLELIGEGKPFEEVGPRLGFSVEERAIGRLSACIRKLVELIENKTFEIKNEDFAKCLNYVISSEKKEKPKGGEMEVCLAMTSRVVATVKNHVSSKERTAILRNFRDRLLPDDASVLQKMEENPKRTKMKPLQLISLTALVAIVVSGLTSFSLYSFSDHQKPAENVVELNADSAKVDSATAIPKIIWQQQSAFLINDAGYAITSSKDLKKGQVIKANNEPSGSASAKVLAIDSSTGLALLKVDSVLTSSVPYRFSRTDVAIGDEMMSLGYHQNQLLFSEATTQSVDDRMSRISGSYLAAGAPLISSKGELMGVVMESGEGKHSVGVEEILDFLENRCTDEVNLPTRNKLYYDSTSKKVEKLKPCILNVKFQS